SRCAAGCAAAARSSTRGPRTPTPAAGPGRRRRRSWRRCPPAHRTPGPRRRTARWGRRRRRGGDRVPALARRSSWRCSSLPWPRRSGVGAQALHPPAPPEFREHALAEPVRLLDVGVAGEDELLDAERRVLLDPVGDLGVAADQGGARAAAHQADARPQVRVDLQVADVPTAALPVALVQGAHALLADRLAGGEGLLRLGDGGGVEPAEQPRRLVPRLRGGVAAEGVQPDAEAHGAALRAARSRMWAILAATWSGGSPQVR